MPPKGQTNKGGTTDTATGATNSVLSSIIHGTGTRGRQRMGTRRLGNGEATAVDAILNHWKAVGREVPTSELPQARQYIADTLLTISNMVGV